MLRTIQLGMRPVRDTPQEGRLARPKGTRTQVLPEVAPGGTKLLLSVTSNPSQSNTPFVGVTGAGGNFDPANTGTGATGNQQNQGNTATGNNTAGTGYGGSGQGGGQPSVGQRLKGTTEKIVGHVAGDPNMVSRGEARKTGGDPTGTNYNN